MWLGKLVAWWGRAALAAHERGRVDVTSGIAAARWTLRARTGKGCCWCGEAIVLFDPFDHRRRQRTRHRGDEHEVGDGRNCHREFMGSYHWTARQLVEARADPCCIYCGEVTDKWEADHCVPLEDGGGHDPTNIVRACIPCHRRKTAAEARARAARRRERRTGQPSLLAA